MRRRHVNGASYCAMMIAACFWVLLSGTAHAQTDPSSVKIIRSFAPIYPPVARRYNIQGVVTVRFTVGTDGRPSNFGIVDSPADVLSQAALRTLAEWEFTKPEAPIVGTFGFTFKLTDEGETAFVFGARTLLAAPTKKSELGKKPMNGWADVRIVLNGARSNDFHIAKISDPSFRKTVEEVIKRLQFSEGPRAVNQLNIRVTDDAPLQIELLPGE